MHEKRMKNKDYLDSELNQKIQNAFDQANTGQADDTPITETKLNQDKTEGKSMSEEDDIGLEFNLPDDLTEEKEEKKESPSEQEAVFDPAESEGLSFNLGDDASEDLEVSAETSGDLELGADDSSGDLELGADISGDLELGEDDAASADVAADTSGDLDLSEDDTVSEDSGVDTSGDLEFGGEEETEGLVAPDEVQAVEQAEEETEELSFEAATEDESAQISDNDLLNVPGAPTDDDMEFTGEEEQKTGSENTGDIDISGLEQEVAPAQVEVEPEPEHYATPVEDSLTPPPFPGKNLSSIDQNELLRLQGLIRTLKEEREDFLKEIAELKTEVRILEQENIGLQASFDESRIEVEILKKRRQEELEESQYQLRNSEDRASVSDQKYKNLKKDFDRMNIRFNEEVSKVKRREKELEGQLELVQMDAENQVNSRDEVIMNLKRKIDVLEFNMENAGIREKQFKDEKIELEEKLNKMMKTLRGSIKLLEEDLEVDRDILEEIKKL